MERSMRSSVLLITLPLCLGMVSLAVVLASQCHQDLDQLPEAGSHFEEGEDGVEQDSNRGVGERLHTAEHYAAFPPEERHENAHQPRSLVQHHNQGDGVRNSQTERGHQACAI